MRGTIERHEASDEDLVESLAASHQEALGPLFNRYAPLVYHIALQSLGVSAAEDLVQEVFLAIWSKAATFDRKKGLFRPWLLQIVHFRILNELRRKGREPPLAEDTDGRLVDGLADQNGGPADEAWRSYRTESVRAAVDQLPPAQRRALSLAFFESLSHDQVATVLRIPLGTAKTRIRSAMKRLRRILVPYGLAALVAAVCAAALGFGLRPVRQATEMRRAERALSFVTASDITTLHLSPAAGQAPGTHGSYRYRAGTALVVMALHDFPPAPAGKVFAGWASIGGTWVPVGTAVPDKDGSALIIGETAALASAPEAVEATLEPAGGSAAPTGPAVIEWHQSSTGK